MTAHSHRRANARIIWAITAKDLLESIKNKNTITILITSLLMVVFYRAMPGLFHGNEPLNVLVYDYGETAGQPSEIVTILKQDKNLDIYTGYSSEAHMKRVLANGDLPELGLVIPADFDQAFAAGLSPPLQGYMMSWVSEEKVGEVHRFVEDEIAQLVGVPVTIQIAGNLLTRSPDSTGLGVQAGIAVIFTLVMIGISVVAHLMLEEKQAQTLDALLVSPANPRQIVTAKALTGVFYCLLGAGLALVINRDLIIHWWLAILAVVVGAAFTVALGLWLGTLIENRGQLTLFAWFFLVPLLIPAFLSVMTELLPPWLVSPIRAIPTTVIFSLLRTSYADPISLGTVALQLAYLLAWTLAVLGIVVWLMRRQDRRVSELGGRRPVLTAEGTLAGSPPDFPAGDTGEERLQNVTQRPAIPPALAMRPGSAEAPSGWRLIAAIAWKDIRDAIRNKLVVSIILGVGIMVASNAFLPRLLNFGGKPTAIVYDPGSSARLQELSAGGAYRLAVRDTREAFDADLSGAIHPVLGLEIPSDFDQLAGAGQPITLQGYYTHWADLDDIQAEAAYFSEVLGVSIDYQAGAVYPAVDAQGQTFLVTWVIVLTIGVMGVSLVPLLIVEEKEARTLDALLASPAGHLHIIAGKALAGFVYCLLTAALLFLVYQHLIVSYGIALLAALAIITFSVAVGLFVGMLSDSPTTTGMWGALLLVGLLGSTVLEAVDQTNWSAWIQTAVRWLPGTLMGDLVRFAMAGEVTVELWLPPLVVLFLQAGVVYLLVAWLLRRKDR